MGLERGSGVWLTLRAKWAEPLKDISSGGGREEDTHNKRSEASTAERGGRAVRCSRKTHQNDENRPKMRHRLGQMTADRHGLGRMGIPLMVRKLRQRRKRVT
ncbi:hypothetical protein E3U43_004823 [Larimichthys crocea]|uniref:Uncharacterized protein n=1 Tax=Larimichthys crocea TaxID=215358 RepID=A0ACD3QGA8_LARCR|nr:hypothetical protein E3U43_004823 [Larimichthys crocea]